MWPCAKQKSKTAAELHPDESELVVAVASGTEPTEEGVGWWGGDGHVGWWCGGGGGEGSVKWTLTCTQTKPNW